MKNAKLKTGGKIVYIPAEMLRSFPQRPRRYFNAEYDDALARSVAAVGIIEPITVFYSDDDFYYIVSGERRYRAALKAGFFELPCIVIAADEADAAFIGFLGNEQRAELNYFEKAEFIERIGNEYAFGLDEMSQRTGLSIREINEITRLLSIPEHLRKTIVENGIDKKTASLLLRHPNDAEKGELLNEIVAEKLSYEQAGEFSREIINRRNNKSRRFVTYFKDNTVFINTIERAVNLMYENGMDFFCEKNEDDDFLEYRIKIPKHDSG
jgi:ParB family chromosome partitioning protein